jgi:hypothetical protein
MAEDMIIYRGVDLVIDFEVNDADGADLDLTGGGRVEVTLQRCGLRPYLRTVTSDDPGAVVWTDRATGTGVLTLPIAVDDVPLGRIRFGMTSVTADGRKDVQSESWATVKRLPGSACP